MLINDVNIFIAHSPFQYLIANHMVNSMKEFSNTDNYLILDSLSNLNNNTLNNWKEIVNLAPSVGRSVLRSGNNCRKALKTIVDICSGYKNINLFRANLEWPLNNAIIGLKLCNPNSNIVYCNYPDGIGSLVYNYPKFKHSVKTKLKHILGLMGGSPFFSYEGDIMGLEFSDRIYSLMPSVLVNRANHKLVQIPKLKPLKINIQTEACIFIGQNYDNYMSLHSYTDLSERAASYTKTLGYKELFYKAHHYDNSGVEREIFTSHGFSIIHDNTPIEDLFLSTQCACVVSYTSSALVNLKLMFSHNIRCIACFSNLTFKRSKINGRQYRKLFELCGVELYN